MIQNIDTMNCKREILYMAIAHIKHKISWMYVQGEDGKEFSLSILTNLSEYFILH